MKLQKLSLTVLGFFCTRLLFIPITYVLFQSWRQNASHLLVSRIPGYVWKAISTCTCPLVYLHPSASDWSLTARRKHAACLELLFAWWLKQSYPLMIQLVQWKKISLPARLLMPPLSDQRVTRERSLSLLNRRNRPYRIASQKSGVPPPCKCSCASSASVYVHYLASGDPRHTSASGIYLYELFVEFWFLSSNAFRRDRFTTGTLIDQSNVTRLRRCTKSSSDYLLDDDVPIQPPWAYL